MRNVAFKMEITPGLEVEPGVNAVIKIVARWLPITFAPASCLYLHGGAQVPIRAFK